MKKILIIVMVLSLLLGNVLAANAAKRYSWDEAEEKYPYENESQQELFEKLIIGQWEDKTLLVQYEAPNKNNTKKGYIYFKDYKEGYPGTYYIRKPYKEICMMPYGYFGEDDYLYIVSLDEKTLVVEYEGKIHTLKRTK